MALVERDLVDVRAVGVHHVQHERRLVAVLVLAANCGLPSSSRIAFDWRWRVEREHDAAVGQVVRRDVVAFLGDDVGGRSRGGARRSSRSYSQMFQVG